MGTYYRGIEGLESRGVRESGVKESGGGYYRGFDLLKYLIKPISIFEIFSACL